MPSVLPRRLAAILVAGVALTAGVTTAGAQQPPPTAPDPSPLNPGARGEPRVLPKERQTLRSALRIDLRQNFARLPLYRARVGGETYWYVITDVSDRAIAKRRGLNFAPKLANLVTPDCPACVQTVRSPRQLGRMTVRRPGAPDFAPLRLLRPGPQDGFPPLAARPGAVARPGYSPYVRIGKTGVVFNAPIVAVGRAPFDLRAHDRTHDRLVGIDLRRRTVDMNFIRAFAHGRDIMYLSFESSSALTAVLDRSTFTPTLGLSPSPDRSRSLTSARSAIFVFANGQLGRTSPPGQGNDHVITDGLNARPLDLRDRELIEALRVGGDAHNVLDSFPTLPGFQGQLYSPLWDVHVAVWSEGAIGQGLRAAQTDANQIRQLAARGLITSPGGSRLASDRSILNCPAIGFLTIPPTADQAPSPPPIP